MRTLFQVNDQKNQSALVLLDGPDEERFLRVTGLGREVQFSLKFPLIRGRLVTLKQSLGWMLEGLSQSRFFCYNQDLKSRYQNAADSPVYTKNGGIQAWSRVEGSFDGWEDTIFADFAVSDGIDVKNVTVEMSFEEASQFWQLLP